MTVETIAMLTHEVRTIHWGDRIEKQEDQIPENCSLPLGLFGSCLDSCVRGKCFSSFELILFVNLLSVASRLSHLLGNERAECQPSAFADGAAVQLAPPDVCWTHRSYLNLDRSTYWQYGPQQGTSLCSAFLR